MTSSGRDGFEVGIDEARVVGGGGATTLATFLSGRVIRAKGLTQAVHPDTVALHYANRLAVGTCVTPACLVEDPEGSLGTRLREAVRLGLVEDREGATTSPERGPADGWRGYGFADLWVELRVEGRWIILRAVGRRATGEAWVTPTATGLGGGAMGWGKRFKGVGGEDVGVRMIGGVEGLGVFGGALRDLAVAIDRGRAEFVVMSGATSDWARVVADDWSSLDPVESTVCEHLLAAFHPCGRGPRGEPRWAVFGVDVGGADSATLRASRATRRTAALARLVATMEATGASPAVVAIVVRGANGGGTPDAGGAA